MKKLVNLILLSITILFSSMHLVSASSLFFFQCKGPNHEHQLIFEHDKLKNNLIQKIQEPDVIQQGRVARETTTLIEEFEISGNYINYLKNNNNFSINRSNGEVLRDNQGVPIKCFESLTDTYAMQRAEIEYAKTTTTEFWSQTNSYANTGYVKLGMLATADDICQVFSHSFFNFSSDEYRALDTKSSDFDWEGINAASKWIYQKFKENGIQLRRFSLMENIHNAANANLSRCLAEKEKISPGFYKKLTNHFLGNLGYLGVQCIEPQFRIEEFIGDNGKIIKQKIPVESQSCIDFDYNSGVLNDWNSSTFTLMLIWKEAHPVLKSIFDKGENIMVARLAELERSRAAQIAEEKALKQMAEATRLKAAKDWSDYQERQKTIMEQVYNFSTTGYPEGLKRLRWIEVQPCILTDGTRQIDNRMLNMTAFRIYRDYIGSAWYMISTDMNVSFSTSEKIPIERLQKAWVLAFQNCPGKTSSF